MARERVNGPYKHRNKFRVVEVSATGQQSVVAFATEREAIEYIKQARKVANGLSVGEAVTEYLQHRAGGPKQLRASTLRLDRWRLEGFFQLASGDRPLCSLTPGAARSIFADREKAVKPDTLVGELATVTRAVRWWVSRGWLPRNPFEGCAVVGQRSAGKPQLRIDEARTLNEVATHHGVPGLACRMALLMGMRATEITGLIVRDVDDGGRVIWLEDNAVRRLKTTRSRKRLEVPDELVAPLVALCRGKASGDRLFPGGDRYWLRYHVERLCKLAKVPVVPPHGLRGTWATIAQGVMPTEAVAATLRNRPEVSRAAYIAPGAEQSAQSGRVASTLLRSPERVTGPEESLPTDEHSDEVLPN